MSAPPLPGSFACLLLRGLVSIGFLSASAFRTLDALLPEKRGHETNSTDSFFR